MPKGFETCPVCHGEGTITENKEEYEYQHRDPVTERCLFCDGSGYVRNAKKPPEATPVAPIEAAPKAKKPVLPKLPYEAPAQEEPQQPEDERIEADLRSAVPLSEFMSASVMIVKLSGHQDSVIETLVKLIREI